MRYFSGEAQDQPAKYAKAVNNSRFLSGLARHFSSATSLPRRHETCPVQLNLSCFFAIMRIAKFHFFLFSSSLGAESKEQFLEEYARKNPELHNQMRGSTSFNFEGEPTQQPPEDRQKGDV